MKTAYNKGNHCIYSIQAHAYFVTKCRRKVLTPAMCSRIQEVCANVLVKNRCTLLEFGGESDHVHLLVDMHPDNNWSHLCGSLKSASSRIVSREFAAEIKPYIPKGLWGKQLYLRSAGGAPLSMLQRYIENHVYG
ncbi:Transposase IS200 like subfamily [Synechococcus sp. PCC 7335]|uniref:IS200/IS605 family transposase n=1 Tax=Synechococcus sp. (strain ATCC 29403 / PCC 7335) TaxID=91464 RepID=UPI00017ECF2A|nr:IS200/IS605 family transposase [Synechococcus sp. PCC 7335]EDX82757.1 Transposase IS200 like subfamily [Synechococcus sp. PCC 7335]